MIGKFSIAALLGVAAIAQEETRRDRERGDRDKGMEWEKYDDGVFKRFEQNMWRGNMPTTNPEGDILLDINGKADWYIYDLQEYEEPRAEDDFSDIVMYKELQFFVKLIEGREFQTGDILNLWVRGEGEFTYDVPLPESGEDISDAMLLAVNRGSATDTFVFSRYRGTPDSLLSDYQAGSPADQLKEWENIDVQFAEAPRGGQATIDLARESGWFLNTLDTNVPEDTYIRFSVAHKVNKDEIDGLRDSGETIHAELGYYLSRGSGDAWTGQRDVRFVFEADDEYWGMMDYLLHGSVMAAAMGVVGYLMLSMGWM